MPRLLIAILSMTVQSDAYCVRDDGVSVGVVLAGTVVEVIEQGEDKSLIYSPRHEEQCWVNNSAFEERGYIHPDDLEQTLKWQTLVELWLPDFPDLSLELVLSVVYKETKGDPHAVDATGNDIRMVGAASVGLMGAIPRTHLPCYQALTAPDGKDAYGCQLYLGMYILNSAIQQAHDLRVGGITATPLIAGVTTQDVECTWDDWTVGWLPAGTRVEGIATVRDATGQTSKVKVFSEKHGRHCWVAIKYLQLDDSPPVVEEAERVITREDIALGLELYGCTLENVLADNCLPWGGETYATLVLDTILPEITEALK